MLVFVVGCFAMFLVKNRHYGVFFLLVAIVPILLTNIDIFCGEFLL